ASPGCCASTSDRVAPWAPVPLVVASRPPSRSSPWRPARPPLSCASVPSVHLPALQHLAACLQRRAERPVAVLPVLDGVAVIHENRVLAGPLGEAPTPPPPPLAPCAATATEPPCGWQGSPVVSQEQVIRGQRDGPAVHSQHHSTSLSNATH